MNRLICTLACLLVSCRFACGQSPSGPIDQEWRSYGHDPGGMRFSPLKQIDRSNVGQLRRLWTCHTGETNWNSIPAGHISAFESTPLMVDSVLYFSTPASRVIALDGETGKEIWIFDPFSDAQTRRTVQNRGVAYWEGNSPVTCSGRARRTDKRIFYGTLDGRLFALDAQTGRPCNGFGNRGAIDLRKGVADDWPKAQYDVTSPPAIYRNLGGSGPRSRIEEMIAVESSTAVRTVKPSESRFAGQEYYPGLAAQLRTRRLAPVVNICGVCVGADKLGHFIQQGYEYFQLEQALRARIKNWSDKERRDFREKITGPPLELPPLLIRPGGETQPPLEIEFPPEFQEDMLIDIYTN